MSNEILQKFYGKQLTTLRTKLNKGEKADQFLLKAIKTLKNWSKPINIAEPKKKLVKLHGALRKAESCISADPEISKFLRFENPELGVTPFEEKPPYPYSEIESILHEYARVVDQAIQEFPSKAGRPPGYHLLALLVELVQNYIDVFGDYPSVSRNSNFHKVIIMILDLAEYERRDVQSTLSQAIKITKQ